MKCLALYLKKYLTVWYMDPHSASSQTGKYARIFLWLKLISIVNAVSFL